MDLLVSVDPLDLLDPLDSAAPPESLVARYEASASSIFTLSDLWGHICGMAPAACSEPLIVSDSVRCFFGRDQAVTMVPPAVTELPAPR